MINKLLLLATLFLLSNCGGYDGPNSLYNTEIDCRDGANYYEILARKVSVMDVMKAIDEAEKLRIKNNSTETYTILIFKDESSFMIPDMTPDRIKTVCQFTEVRRNKRDWKRYFSNFASIYKGKFLTQ